MGPIAACTITPKRHLAQAQSFHAHHPDIPFRVLLADALEGAASWMSRSCCGVEARQHPYAEGAAAVRLAEAHDKTPATVSMTGPSDGVAGRWTG